MTRVRLSYDRRRLGFWTALLPLGLLIMDFSTAAAILVALYLAVLFQTFGGEEDDATRGSPFASGLYFSNRRRGDINTAMLVLGQVVAAVSGVTCALTRSATPVVWGAVGFLILQVPMRHMIWAFLVAFSEWGSKHQDAVLNGAFALPVLGYLIGLGVSWLAVG
jgi:hypothetical protein